MDSKRLILITGANGGIGFELARQLLANANKHVLLGSRSLQKGESAVAELMSQHLNGTVELIQVDVTSETLDALVNNAGIAGANGTNAEELTACLRTNAVGAQLMGDYFAPLLRKSTTVPRIINNTSGAGSIALRFDRSHPSATLKVNAYRISKAAMNMVAACQWYDWGEEGFKIFIYGPGNTESNLSALNKVEKGAKPVSEGTAPMVAMLDGERDEDSGKFINYGYDSFPW
ncbi:MAG: hypothetical protein Q9205_007111 [Flavoplaca limonia]